MTGIWRSAALSERNVVRGFRIFAHEGVIELFLAGVDLLVYAALVVVPEAPALPGEHGPDAQKERHVPGFEDPALGVPKWPALTFEHEPAADVMVAQHQVTALHAADVVERGLTNDGVAGDQLVGRHRTAQRGRRYPGQGLTSWSTEGLITAGGHERS